MREFTVFAPAKLNLFLDVLGKRPDGYHEIATLFEKIDLKDEIFIKEKRAKGFNVRVKPAVCAAGRDNIVHKALSALLREARPKPSLGLEVVINKKIPVGAGLGGGSSDAAAVLRAINDNFGLGISRDRLFAIAAKIGKDVPFFLADKTFAMGSGLGEILRAIDVDWSLSHVIIKPKISKSTKRMYARLDGHRARLGKGNINKTISAIETKDLDLLRKSCYNIFKDELIGCDRRVLTADTLLRDSGAGPRFLSGSGPSVFCVLKKREEAIEIFQRIPKGSDMEVFVATSCKN